MATPDVDNIIKELKCYFPDQFPEGDTADPEAAKILVKLAKHYSFALPLHEDAYTDHSQEILMLLKRDFPKFFNDSKVEWEKFIHELCDKNEDLTKRLAPLLEELAKCFPNDFPVGPRNYEQAVEIFWVIKQTIPNSIREDKIDAKYLLKGEIKNLIPGAILGDHGLDWAKIARYMCERGLGRVFLERHFPYAVHDDKIDDQHIKSELNFRSWQDDDKASQERAKLADHKLAYGLQRTQHKHERKHEKTRLAHKYANESQRTVSLVSGIIISLLFPIIFTLEEPDPLILWLALFPIGFFSLAILHLLFISHPLNRHALKHDIDLGPQELSGFLKWVVLFTIYSPFQCLFPRTDVHTSDYTQVQIRKKHKYIKINHVDLDRLSLFQYAWFLLGIFSSIGLAAFYISELMGMIAD